MWTDVRGQVATQGGGGEEGWTRGVNSMKRGMCGGHRKGNPFLSEVGVSVRCRQRVACRDCLRNLKISTLYVKIIKTAVGRCRREYCKALAVSAVWRFSEVGQTPPKKGQTLSRSVKKSVQVASRQWVAFSKIYVFESRKRAFLGLFSSSAFRARGWVRLQQEVVTSHATDCKTKHKEVMGRGRAGRFVTFHIYYLSSF